MNYICVFLCALLCNIINGYSITAENNNLKTRRIPRSPVTYVADENGHRVIIITLKTPNTRVDSSDLVNKDNKPKYGYPVIQQPQIYIPMRFNNFNTNPQIPSNSFKHNTNTQNQQNLYQNNVAQDANQFDNNINQKNYPQHTNINLNSFDPSLAPGALKIIDLLRNLGIPGLPEFVIPTTQKSIHSYSAPFGGSIPGGDGGPIGSPGFGADISAGLLGGGFGRSNPNVEKPKN